MLPNSSPGLHECYNIIEKSVFPLVSSYYFLPGRGGESKLVATSFLLAAEMQACKTVINLNPNFSVFLIHI